jgi:type I restriction enzyme M protein
MTTSNGHVSFIWFIADQELRGQFKQSEYGRIILPFVVLRRLDQVLAPTKDEVLEQAARYEGRGLNLDPILKRAADQRFYNASKFDLTKAHSDAENVGTHLQAYLAGFDPVVREIFEAFEFEATLLRLQKAGLLYRLLGRFLDDDLDLHPDIVPNSAMGDIFEELIRKFSEISNETAGEHFTPREVVRLCAELVLAGDEELLTTSGIVRSVYDPACGTGGMLSVVEELVRERNEHAKLVLFGQELNPESWAICRAEMLLKGQDPSRIAPGSTLSDDGNADGRFNLMLANPPFGVDWTKDHDKVIEEKEEQGFDGRFGAGVPRKSDGALLFLQNMLAKMKSADEDGGSRVAIIFNGSPLFSGAAGSGESDIRKWIIENDWLEAVVALPEQLFYNTGLATYIWVLTDNKEAKRQHKVQFIDARDMWEPLPRNLGDKRRRLSLDHIAQVLDLWRDFEPNGDQSTVLANEFLGYRRITVEQPLRLRYRVGEAGVGKLAEQAAFQKLIDPPKGAEEEAAASAREAGEATQQTLIDALRALNGVDTTSREEMEVALKPVFAAVDRMPAALKKVVWEAASWRDPSAPVVTKWNGDPEPDPDLRDTENVPLQEDVDDYMEREVLPYAPEAWVDADKTKVGYEVPFTRVFFKFEPPRDPADIDAELKQAEREVQRLLQEVTD